MGLGNGNAKSGNKGSNFNYELRELQLLGMINNSISGIAPPGGLATESTLLDVLAAIDMMRDYEVRLVQDSDTPPVTWLEVRYWDAQSGALGAPVYYPPGSTVAGTPVGSLSYINPNALLTSLLGELVAQTALLTSLDGKDFATETTLSAIETLITSLDSKDFATETTLAAIETLVTSLDGKDYATETTLAAIETLMTSLDGKDYATETTLAAIETLVTSIDGKDFATETTLLATETTLNALEVLLTSIDGKDFATETTLAAIETLLTGTSRVPSVTTATIDGSTSAGVKQVSLWFRGTGGTLDGESVPPGARFTFSADDNNDTVAAVAYTVPTGGPQEIIITYLT
jgi:hypothetical protein